MSSPPPASIDSSRPASLTWEGNKHPQYRMPGPRHPFPAFPLPADDEASIRAYKSVRDRLIELWTASVVSSASPASSRTSRASFSAPREKGGFLGMLARRASRDEGDADNSDEDIVPISPLPRLPKGKKIWDPPVKDKKVRRAFEIAAAVVEEVEDSFDSNPLNISSTLADYIINKPPIVEVKIDQSRVEEKGYMKLFAQSLEPQRAALQMQQKMKMVELKVPSKGHKLVWATKFLEYAKGKLEEQENAYLEWVEKLKEEKNMVPGGFYPPYGGDITDSEDESSDDEEELSYEAWMKQLAGTAPRATRTPHSQSSRDLQSYMRKARGRDRTSADTNTSSVELPSLKSDKSRTWSPDRLATEEFPQELKRRVTDWEAELKEIAKKERDRQEEQLRLKAIKRARRRGRIINAKADASAGVKEKSEEEKALETLRGMVERAGIAGSEQHGSAATGTAMSAEEKAIQTLRAAVHSYDGKKPHDDEHPALRPPSRDPSGGSDTTVKASEQPGYQGTQSTSLGYSGYATEDLSPTTIRSSGLYQQEERTEVSTLPAQRSTSLGYTGYATEAISPPTIPIRSTSLSQHEEETGTTTPTQRSTSLDQISEEEDDTEQLPSTDDRISIFDQPQQANAGDQYQRALERLRRMPLPAISQFLRGSDFDEDSEEEEYDPNGIGVAL